MRNRKRRGKTSIPIIPVLVFFLSGVLFSITGPQSLEAQADPDSDLRSRRLVLFYRHEGGGDLAPQKRRFLYESLLLALTEVEKKLIIIESAERRPAEVNSRLDELAIEATGDAWLYAKLRGGFDRLVIEISAYDLVTREDHSIRFGPFEDIDYRDLERRFWKPVIEWLEGRFEPVSSNPVLSIEGAPGTKIIGIGEEPLFIDESGLLALRLPAPTSYRYRAESWDHYPEEGYFYLEQEPMEIDLEQEPASRFVVDAYLDNFSFPGASFGVYFVPNFFYLKVGITTYLAGIHIGSGSGAIAGLFVSKALNRINLETGTYINQEDALIRVYGGLGAFLRLIMPQGYFGFDPLSPFGGDIVTALEFSLSRKFRVYLEYRPTFYFSKRPGLLYASYPDNYDPFHIIELPFGLIDYLKFRLGLRIQL